MVQNYDSRQIYEGEITESLRFLKIKITIHYLYHVRIAKNIYTDVVLYFLCKIRFATLLKHCST